MSIILGMSVLTINIQSVNANPGCITITVQYANGCPRPGADVLIKNDTIPWFVGQTLRDGKVTNCNLNLSEGAYIVWAEYPSNIPFGYETLLQIDDNGDRNATISENYNFIKIFSPEEKTYTTSSVSLNFTIVESTSWIGYSLDGQSNVTITGNDTLTSLDDGSHNIIMYANDTSSDPGPYTFYSDTVYFTVSTSQPVGGIQFPVNKPLLILHLVASYASYIALIATIAIVSVIIFVKRKKGKG